MPKYLIGADEVGWGAVAGPLTVCACYVPPENYELLRNQGFRDSKEVGNRLFTNPKNKKTEITGPKCLRLVQWLESASDERVILGHRPLASWAVNSCEPATIDNMTPADAKNREFRSAVMRLIQANNWTFDQVKVIIDGNQKIKGLSPLIEQETMPKADSLFLPAAVASVIAKATRDNYMNYMHQLYPEYDFISNKGYGTIEHLEKVLKLGPITGVHRWHYMENWVINHYKKTRPPTGKDIPKWLYSEKWINEILEYITGGDP